MSIKIKLLLFSLFCSLSLFAQKPISEMRFFKNSDVFGGVSFSRMLNDELFDEDHGKAQFGYSYHSKLLPKWELEATTMFSVKGGKSFSDRTFQNFAYLDFPILFNYTAWKSFSPGIGVVPSLLLYNESKIRGVRQLINPMPENYRRYPNETDLSIMFSGNLHATQYSTLTFQVSTSLFSSSRGRDVLQFGMLGLQYKVRLAGVAKVLENKKEETREIEREFLKMKDGKVVVILNDRRKLADFYTRKGETEKAEQVLKNAELLNRQMQLAFKQKFDFTDVLFVSHQEYLMMKRGDTINVLDDKRNPISSTQLLENAVFFFMPGDIYWGESSIARDGYYFMDESFEKLDYPFPALDIIPTIESFDVHHYVSRLNSKLHSRYELISNYDYLKE